MRECISAITALRFGLMIAPGRCRATCAGAGSQINNFFVNELGNWRAPDTRTLIFRVRGYHYPFRLDRGI